MRRALAPWIVAAGAMATLIGVLVLDLRRPPAALPVVRFDMTTPPTREPMSFAISPDGEQLAFVAMSEGASKLWLRQLAQTTARAIPGTDGATYPFWSPDSRSIGFFAGAKLKRLDIDGGAPRALADAPAGRGGTWNRDGMILFTADALMGPTSNILSVPGDGWCSESGHSRCGWRGDTSLAAISARRQAVSFLQRVWPGRASRNICRFS